MNPILLVKILRELCGYVEDGSNQSITLLQDDATKDWILKTEKMVFIGSSMNDVLEQGGKHLGILP